MSWLRNGGMETTHLSHLYAFITLDMIPAITHTSISPLGASAVSSKHGEGVFDSTVRVGINEDEAGIKSGGHVLARAIELVGLMHSSRM